MNGIRVVGIDLGKNVFHLICVNAEGGVVKRRRCTRPQLFAFFRGLQPALVGMEACASGHFVARTLTENLPQLVNHFSGGTPHAGQTCELPSLLIEKGFMLSQAKVLIERWRRYDPAIRTICPQTS